MSEDVYRDRSAVFDFADIAKRMGPDKPLTSSKVAGSGTHITTDASLADMLEKGNEVAWKEFPPTRDGYPELMVMGNFMRPLPPSKPLEVDNPYFVMSATSEGIGCSCPDIDRVDKYCPMHGNQSF